MRMKSALWSGLARICLAVVLTRAGAAGAAERLRVLVAENLKEPLAEVARKHGNLELITASDREQLRVLAPGLDAIVGLGREYLVELLPHCARLRWIQVPNAGVERYVNIPGLVESDVVLTNLKIHQGPEIADHAMALLLNVTRDLKGYNEKMAAGRQVRDPRLPLIELRGKTMLIIGLGGIGTQLAERASAFGMRVVAIDAKDIPHMRAVDYVGKPDELHALLPQADVVVSCVPHTPETEKMLNAEAFARMKDGVYLVNVSRGAVVDTDALVAALKSGKVRAAGLDVTNPEPLPPDHPLWSMPNVTITPHIATHSDQVGARALALFRDNLSRFAQGLPLKNVVMKEKGY